jgi:serine O-acetyltransferase
MSISKSIESIRFLVADLKRAWGGRQPFPGAFVFAPCIWLTVWSIIYYRIARALYLLPPPLRQLFAPFRLIFKRIVQVATGTDISERAEIGPGFFIAHNGTLVIGSGTKAGKNFFVRQGVTVGGDSFNGGHPTFGDNVMVGANAVIVGKLTIGSDVIIGANAVVTKDFPSDCVVAGVPAKAIVGKSGRWSPR